MCSIDETGSTLERKSNGIIQIMRIRRSGSSNKRMIQVPTFSNVSRLPVVFAKGESGQPMFVIKGKNILF